MVQQGRLVARPHAVLARAPVRVADDVAGRRGAGRDPRGVGPAVLVVRLRAVDQVAAEHGQFDAVDELGGPGAGFGELFRDAPRVQHGGAGDTAGGVGEQVERGGLALDVRPGAVLRVLGAVPGLRHRGLAEGHGAREGPERGHVVGAHERGTGGRRLPHSVHLPQVAPFGLLQCPADANPPYDVFHDAPIRRFRPLSTHGQGAFR